MKRLKKIISEVMHVKPDSITDQTSPKNVKKWDSLRGLLLITAIENNYKIKFTSKDMMLIKNVGDIKRVLKKYKVKLEG